MTVGTAPDVLSARLADFLSPYGVTLDELRAAVEQALGQPLAVIATGSVLQGFGNERSDVDIFVVVERENLTRLPIMSYQGTARIDTSYYGAAEFTGWLDALREPWPYASPLSNRTWVGQLRRLHAVTRFAAGLVLDARDDWRERLAGLRSPWLVDRVVEWWTTEAVRQRTAARWLSDSHPRLAAQRWCDAVLAALERRAALAGQLSLTQKWLPEKVKAVGDDEALAMVREVLRIPVAAAELPAYRSRCEELLERLLPVSPWYAELYYARGAQVMPVGDRTLVSRWGMRGVEVAVRDLPAIGEPEPVWRGAAGEDPPAPVLSLFREDMLWLSISS